MYNTFRHFRRFYPLALCSVPLVGIVKAKTDINEGKAFFSRNSSYPLKIVINYQYKGNFS